jgi:hypothetical protein
LASAALARRRWRVDPRLLDIGRRDAERQHDRIAAFLEGVSVPKQQRRAA